MVPTPPSSPPPAPAAVHHYALHRARVTLSLTPHIPSEDLLFHHYRVPEPPPGPSPERFQAWEDDGRWWLRHDPHPPDPLGDAPLHLQGLEYLLAYRLLAGNPGLVQLHAGGAVVGNGSSGGAGGEVGAVLILGASGSGKSSLVWTLGQGGLPVLGDDVVFLDGEARCLPFRRWLKLEPDAESYLDLGAPGPGRVRFPDAWRVDPASLAGGVAGPAPVRWIVAARYAPGAATALKPLPPAQALRMLLDAAVETSRSGAGATEVLWEVAERASAATLRFGAASSALPLLLEWLGGGQPPGAQAAAQRETGS